MIANDNFESYQMMVESDVMKLRDYFQYVCRHFYDEDDGRRYLKEHARDIECMGRNMAQFGLWLKDLDS